MKNRLLCIGVAMLFITALTQSQVMASHLKIDKTLLSEVNTAKQTARIQFNVSWDNAWKDDVNCDGVWVFAKYQTAEGLWGHVSIKAASAKAFDYTDQTPESFSKGNHAELGMWVPEEKKGVFLFRTSGQGTTASDKVELIWEYARNGLSDDAVMKARIKVLGVEMVYIPEDKHHVGDPNGPIGPDNCFYTFPSNGTYQIKSEDEILVDKVDGALYCDQDNVRSRDDVPFTVPKEFPKGFKAMWMMKYELTSQQFADFLNMLTRKQQQSMVESDISGDEIKDYYVKTKSDVEHLRCSIVTAKKGNGTTAPVKFYTYAPARALNFMSWANITAYGDWAGLRPITELEYEKACRGPKDPVADEYAWGTKDLGRADTFDGADGSGLEKKVPQQGVVNCCYGGGIAPFDAAAGKTIPDNPGFEGPVTGELFENSQAEGVLAKINNGASYYGVRNLTGNTWERCVTVGHKTGRAYAGIHGDGELAEDGFANVANWPGKDGAGAGNRGGVWSSPSGKFLRFALRFAANFPKSEDGKNSGCRLGF